MGDDSLRALTTRLGCKLGVTDSDDGYAARIHGYIMMMTRSDDCEHSPSFCRQLSRLQTQEEGTLQ
eukprot:1745965-Rhodomonas_salina.1